MGAVIGPFLSLRFRDRVCFGQAGLEFQVWEAFSASASPVLELHAFSWTNVDMLTSVWSPPHRTLTHQRNNSTQILLVEPMGSLWLLFRSTGCAHVGHSPVAVALQSSTPAEVSEKCIMEYPFQYSLSPVHFSSCSRPHVAGAGEAKGRTGDFSNFFC